MKPLRIRSWFLARFLGVTDRPAGDGEFMPVKIRDMPEVWLWWRIA
jgi:hypothetical protein